MYGGGGMEVERVFKKENYIFKILKSVSFNVHNNAV